MRMVAPDASILSMSGWLPDEIFLQDRQVPHGVAGGELGAGAAGAGWPPDTSVAQLQAIANSLAAARFPTPSIPVNKSA